MHKLQGERLFARDSTLQQCALFFDVLQAPGTQHVTITGGQSQGFQLGTEAAQGVQLLDAALEAQKWGQNYFLVLSR